MPFEWLCVDGSQRTILLPQRRQVGPSEELENSTVRDTSAAASIAARKTPNITNLPPAGRCQLQAIISMILSNASRPPAESSTDPLGKLRIRFTQIAVTPDSQY